MLLMRCVALHQAHKFQRLINSIIFGTCELDRVLNILLLITIVWALAHEQQQPSGGGVGGWRHVRCKEDMLTRVCLCVYIEPIHYTRTRSNRAATVGRFTVVAWHECGKDLPCS